MTTYTYIHKVKSVKISKWKRLDKRLDIVTKDIVIETEDGEKTTIELFKSD